MIKDFQIKLKLLPADIQDILLSDEGGFKQVELAKKYSLPSDKYYLLGDTISLLYFGDLKLLDLVEYLAKNFSISHDQAEKLACDIVGFRLLPARSNFKIDLEKYISGLSGDIKKYSIKPSIVKIESKIPKEVDVGYVDYDVKNERESAPKVFQENLLDLLSGSSSEFMEIIDDYNGILIEIMNQDKNFQRSLEESIYANQQKIGNQTILLETKRVEPTIANWLKDFISKNGTNYFDGVVLSQYVINSENAKKLNSEEKKILTKLLQLYRNIKFFPANLANQPESQWEIIPIDREVRDEESEQAESFPTESNWPKDGRDWDFLASYDVKNMTPIELRAFMDENNLKPADIEKLKR